MMWNVHQKRLLLAVAAVELALLISTADGFLVVPLHRPADAAAAASSSSSRQRRNSFGEVVGYQQVNGGGGSSRIIRPVSSQEEIKGDEVQIEWIEEEYNDEDDDDDIVDSVDDDEEEEAKKSPRSSRWDNLNPAIKARIVKAAEERAIANKKKREPAHAKKRRMMMFMKEKQREQKKASRVKRPIPFKDRTPLSALVQGMELTGVVISLTNFGAYVDVGTECDGLLHISQFTRDYFVEHPRQVVSPGDEITVRVRSTEPEMKKLQLTMLPKDILDSIAEDEDDAEDRIRLDEIAVDDELWGEIRRVTDYGAYVDVGASVSGFLHFMDHPAFGWSNGCHPSEYMGVGDRVRSWVSDVDTLKQRIKLTANRPPHLPGPRREIPM